MGKYLGDFVEDAIVRGSFNTRDAAGAPITLAGTPAVSVYKDAGATESTAGVTLTVDFDSRTGHHVFAIDTSADAFYVTGADYRVVITAGTVDGVSVVGVEVGSFSISRTLTAIGDSAGVTTLLERILGIIRTAADDVTAEAAQTAAIRDGLALEATAQSIKGKTDGLTFTVENQVDVNVKSYNGTLQSNGDLPLKIDAVKSVVDSIVAKTDNLPESPAATSDVQVTVEPEITVNPTTLDSGERVEIATAVWAKELSEGNTAASFVMRLTSGFASLITNLAAMITGSGAEAKYTVLALENGPSGEGSGLAGPYTRTITITDSVSSLPVQNATVRFYRTGYTESKATNSSGVASFTVEAAVWSYAIIADGYIGQSDNVTVGASGDTPISLVLRSPVEVTADTTALTFRVSSQGNASLAGVVASAKLIGEGYTVVGETVGINVIEEDTSDAEGMVTLVLFRESDYDLSVKRTNGTTYKLRIRTSDEETTTISEAIEV
jgi:hypothetical protein